MSKYLVAADADQIQNFLFRASHLREVIGGSMQLAKFCEEGTKEALDGVGGTMDENRIISAGGSFRLEFDDPVPARNFLDDLAERFRQQTGSTLTVAGPVAYELPEFKTKNGELQLRLMEAKLEHDDAEAVAHTPATAFCASCGTEYAITHSTPTPEIEDEELQDPPMYLCRSCYNKAQNRGQTQQAFFDRFREDIKVQHPTLINHRLKLPYDPAELIGSLDPTQYVGYIKADGNGMGRRFNNCDDPKQLKTLSNRLNDALWRSLASPVKDLLERIGENREKFLEIPIVPLIVGGDDLFVLVPARYALDIARRIGEKFEEEMGDGVTIAMAVVICQQHYPYTLAHDRAEKLLKTAKKIGKHEQVKLSTVSFETIIGNRLSTAEEIDPPFLKTFFIGDEKKIASKRNFGLSLRALLEQRTALKDVPNKRLNEIRRLFDQAGGKTKSFDEAEFRRVQKKIAIKAFDNAVHALGNEGEDNDLILRTISMPDEERYYAHGLANLIEMWQYAYMLDVPANEYQPEVV